MNEFRESNREIVTLIWFDPSIDIVNERTKAMKHNLQAINDYVLFFNNMSECVLKIDSITNEKVFLVVPGLSASSLLEKINHFSQLDAVFIFCQNIDKYLPLMEKYKKIVGIYTDHDKLDESIRNNLRVLSKHTETFYFYNQRQKSTLNISEGGGDHLCFKLLHNLLMRLPMMKTAKDEMLQVCREYYHGNKYELKKIDEFQKKYTNEKCVEWFTNETFVYRLVNKALQTGDVNQLYLFRFFIVDLSLMIANQQQSNNHEQETPIRIVYRGVRLASKRVNDFHSSQGQLISFNGYLSTSRSSDIAMGFTRHQESRSLTIPVLFQIKCDTDDNQSCVFADVAHLSAFPYEREVLFDLGAVFEIESVILNSDICKIDLNLVGQNSNVIQDSIDQLKREIHTENDSVLFGSLLNRMGFYECAFNYFQKLLRSPAKEVLVNIQHQFGLVYYNRAEYSRAIDWFDKALDSMQTSSINHVKIKAMIWHDLSVAHTELGLYDSALAFCRKIEESIQTLGDSDSIELGLCYHQMGSIFMEKRKYSNAMDWYEKSLNIKQLHFPADHVQIGETMNAIGLVHFIRNDYEQAFNFYSEALKIFQKCLPGQHPYTADVVHNISEYFHEKQKFDEALNHAKLALKWKESRLSKNHPSLAKTVQHMSNVLNTLGDTAKALKLCLKAVKIRERHYPMNHPLVIESYMSVALQYDALKNEKFAIEYFEKVIGSATASSTKVNLMRKTAEQRLQLLKQNI